MRNRRQANGQATYRSNLLKGQRAAAAAAKRKKKQPGKKQPSEYRHQCVVYGWSRLQYKTYPDLWSLHSVPNGAILAAPRQVGMKVPPIVKLKREGMRNGIPDLVLPSARAGYFGLYVEMKRDDGGAGLSDDQKEWRDYLVGAGYLCVQANGSEAGINIILEYVKQPKTQVRRPGESFDYLSIKGVS